MTVFLLACGHLLSDFYSNFLPILLPVIMPKLGLSLTLSGLLVFVMSFTSNLLQPFIGYFMDKRNFAWLLVPSVPFGAFVICNIGYVDTQPALFLVIALTGLSVSAFHPLASSLVGRTADPHKMGSAMSYFIAGGNLGFALSPIILAQFIEQFSMAWLPVFIAPSLLLALAYHRSPLPHLSTVQEAGTKQAGRLSLNAPLLLLNAAMGCRTWAYMTAANYLPLYLIAHGVASTLSGVMLTLLLAGGVAGGLFGGWMGDRIGHRRIMAGLLTLALLPLWCFYGSELLTPLAIVSLFFCGFCLQGPQPSSVVWAQRLLPNNAAVASGMMMGLSFGLGSIGTAITAALADRIGLDAALLWSLVPVIVAALLVMMVRLPERCATNN